MNSPGSFPERETKTKAHPLAIVLLGFVLSIMLLQVMLVRRSSPSKVAEPPVLSDAGRKSLPVRVKEPLPTPAQPQKETPALHLKLALKRPLGELAADQPLKTQQILCRRLQREADCWTRLGWLWTGRATRTQHRPALVSARASGLFALSLAPGYEKALWLLADVNLRLQRPREALKAVQQLLHTKPSLAKAWDVVFEAQMEQGKLALAKGALQTLRSLRNDVSTALKAARLRWMQGDSKAALTTLEKALQAASVKKSKRWKMRLMAEMARIYWAEGKWKKAGDFWNQITALKESHATAQLGLAMLAARKREWNSADSHLHLSDRNTSQHLLLHARVRAGMGDVGGAGDKGKQALRQARFESPLNLTIALSVQGKPLWLLLATLKQELKRRPNNPFVQDALAWLYYKDKKYKKALKASQKAMFWKTRQASFWFHRGAILMKLGQKKAGRAWLKKALKLNDSFDTDKVRLAQTLLKATDLP